MKRFQSSFSASLCGILLSVCFGVAWGEAGSLNAAPTPAAKTPGKTNIAVINMKNASGVTAGEIEVISDRLRGDLFNTGKVNVMERDQMQEILKEQGFQQSGACTNEACMVEIGQLLGVEQLVTGSLGKVGSMFLVNLRVIDVKTAKIVKVVSEDIKGEIDEVVSVLPSIASRLVEPADANAQPIALEKKETPAKEETKKEEPKKEETKKAEIIATPETKETPAPVETPSDEKKEKNKNRAGIRLAFNFFGNGLIARTHVAHYDQYDNYMGTDVYAFADSDYTFSPLINPQLKFFFKAGPFLTIDLGPSYSYEAIESKNTVDQYGDYLNILGMAVGVNFVKRWYPVKLNIGLMVDFNYLLNMEEWKYADIATYSGTSDSTAFHNSFNIAAGFRGGAEIMAGKHVGFNLDLLFQYSYFETVTERYDFSDGSYNNWYFSYLLPVFGIGLGVNFYY